MCNVGYKDTKEVKTSMFSLFLTNKKDAASAYATTRDASFVNFAVLSYFFAALP